MGLSIALLAAGVAMISAYDSGVVTTPAPAITAHGQSLSVVDAELFGRQPITLENGIEGRLVRFSSQNPAHFREWFAGELGAEVELSGQVFFPISVGRHPLIVIVPGSANIGPHHLRQASKLVSAGFAVLLIDPFFGRLIHSTAGDQEQLSWAASVLDIFAAIKAISDDPNIDTSRIGLLGSSRGGFAVVTAMTDQVSRRFLPANTRILAGFAGYPWCGLQFWQPRLAQGSAIEIFSGDRDDWVSVQQCQSLVQALAQDGSAARMKLLPSAGHAFDRSGEAPTFLPEIPRTTRFPTVYMDDDGRFFDPRTGQVNASLSQGYFLEQVVSGGFVERGVTVGGTENQSETYDNEMLEFFSREFGEDRTTERGS